MLTSYKFWYITRNDDGFITEAGIRFYEGEERTVTVKEIDKKNEIKEISVNRYIRTKQLSKDELNYLSVPTKKEANGNDVAVFTNKDFGEIKTNEELCGFLNKQLAKDLGRTPINEQK